MKNALGIFLAVLLSPLALADVFDGTYKGINEYIDATVTVTIDGSRANMETLKNGRRSTYSGTLGRGTLSFGGALYVISREGRGIRLTLKSNPRNTSYYARVGDGGNPRPPSGGGSQHVGTYSGYNAWRNADMQISINSRNQVVCTFRYRDGRTTTLTGRHDMFQNQIVLPDLNYNVESTTRGLAIHNAADPKEALVLRESGGGWGSDHENWGAPGNPPPSWLVGNWKGVRWDGDTMNLWVDPDGRLSCEYVAPNGQFERVSGSFKDSSLYLGRARFTVRRQGNSIRLFYVGTQYTVDLYRTR